MTNYTEYTYIVRVRVDDDNGNMEASVEDKSEPGLFCNPVEAEFGPLADSELGHQILAHAYREQFGPDSQYPY